MRRYDPDEAQHVSMTNEIVKRNPFYLISTACVIHGTSFWFRASGSDDPWLLMAMLGVFIAMLAGIGVALIRLGQVWDDARSIFLLLFLLFIELSVSFDQTLVSSPSSGSFLMFVGWLAQVFVFEGIVRALRIRFDIRLRVPVHIMFALLFLYPLTMLEALSASDTNAIHWQLFAFGFAVAGCILTLIPAARNPGRAVRRNGTPWTWPVYPWTLFGLVITGLIVRCYAMCMSLDPALMQSVSAARELNSIFAPYFLFPVILALAVLLLELSRSTRSVRLRCAALIMPPIAVFLSMPPSNASLLQREFLRVLADHVGSPVDLAIVASVFVYAYAMWRGTEGAAWCFTFAVLAVTLNPHYGLESFEPVIANGTALLLLAGFHVLEGIRRRKFRHLIFAACCAAPSLHGTLQSIYPAWLTLAIEIHATLLLCLVSGVRRQSPVLRALAALLLTCCCVGVMLPELIPSQQLSPMGRLAYAGFVLIMSMTLIARWRITSFAVSAVLSSGFLVSHFGLRAWHQLRQIDGWQGLLFYAAGLVWLVIAVAVSMLKTGHKVKYVSRDPRDTP